jgi:hypothetical protein
VFTTLNANENKDPNPIEQFGFDEFWNNNGAF